jgi:cystathionine gamma-lyase
MNWTTRLVHAGHHDPRQHGDLNVPICMSTTFEQPSPGVPKSTYEYSRSGNPTRSALERSLADLEEAPFAVAFASGLGAMTAILCLLRGPAPHVLCSHDVYGGTARLLNSLGTARFNLSVDYHDFAAQPSGFLDLMKERDTQLLWLETVSNPTLQVIDLVAVVRCARALNPTVLIVVDNTFLTPVLQRPLHLYRYMGIQDKNGGDDNGDHCKNDRGRFWGADLVIHSVTKYINGHCDVVMGAVMTGRADLHEQLQFAQNALGIVPGPFECYLVTRSIKTLELRVRRQCQNALTIAQFLASHQRIARVLYPGLPAHPAHAVLQRQQEWTENGPLFGAMLAVELQCAPQEVAKFLANLRVFTLAESLGGVESLVEVPALMTHRGLGPQVLGSLGITPAFLRLSIGIEDVRDLIGDLSSSLSMLP